MTDDIEALSLSGRVVLLTVTHLSQAEETPVHTGEVIRASSDILDDTDVETLGKVSEAEVSRALNRLEADGLVDMVDDDGSSPVGKGRPAYELAMEASAVVDTLRDDDDVAPVVERVAD